MNTFFLFVWTLSLFCGSALLLSYTVGAMANKTNKLGSSGLDECNYNWTNVMVITLMEGLKTLKTCGEILISHPK